MKTNKLICSFISVILIISSCKTGKLFVKRSEDAKRKEALLEADGIKIKSHPSHSLWELAVYDERYDFAPYPGMKTKSITITEDTPARKTLKMESLPFSRESGNFIKTQEVTGVKGFPGLFFRIRQKNIGTSPAFTSIEQYWQMKGDQLFTYKGKQSAGMPRRRKTGIKNWIFLPDGKKGLGVLVNYSQPGLEFVSNLGRRGRDGKRILDPAKSSWGLRLSKTIQPGKVGELIFALVAADSVEETIKLSEEAKRKNIFPELKLEKEAASVKIESIPKETVKSIVKPIMDPKQYSAETLDAKTIDEWVKKEIRPEQFDIWHGKKNRIYLNGSWKFLRLSGTKELPNCEFGVEHGFQKSDFNDKDWFNQPVPYLWNVPFEPEPETRSKRRLVFGGVGWYRKKTLIPLKDKGERVILCFKGVDQECVVYVNGQKARYHKTINIDRPSGLFSTQQAPFEVDISDIVNYGTENTIAVRIYDNGWFKHSNYEKLKKYRSGIGGIWQEVFLDIRHRIYLKKALCSFDVKNSFLTVEAFVANTEKQSVKEKLELELSPWQSARYSLAKGKSEHHKLGEFTLAPGMNRLRFKIKIDSPKLWSPEKPFLYAMKLKNADGAILGQERIGLREFRACKNYFYLNGNKITLRGQIAAWTNWQNAPGSRVITTNMGLMNRRGAIEKWFDMYKSVNHNIVRNHSTFYPHSFYDIADEKGIMIYLENYFILEKPFFNKNGKIMDIYKKKIDTIAEEIQRYPSIVSLSLKNEPFDQHLIGKNIDSYQAYLNQVYNVFKAHAPQLLLSASGRPPTEKSLDKTGTKPYSYAKFFAKTDFYTMHNYQMCWYDNAFAEDDDWDLGFKKYYDSYALDDGPKVVWNTESNITSIPNQAHGYSRALDKKFRPHVHNDMIDRKWFVANWKLIDSQKYGTISLNRSVPKFGFLNTVLRDRSAHTQANFNKRITELHRRKRDYCAGVVGCNAQIFKGQQCPSDMGSIFNEPVAEATRQANQPVLACLDEKWNRNIFSGHNAPTPLYLMNDHENDITDVEISISLESIDKKSSLITLKSVKTGILTPAEMKTTPYSFNIPESIVSGHYSVILKTKYQLEGKSRESFNNYKTYILNRGDIKLTATSKDKIALLASSGSETKKTVGMLEKLQATFSIIENLEELKNFKILILPPDNQILDKEIIRWIQKGGKLLSFSQKKNLMGIPQTIRATGRYGFFTELILKTHPVLKGLEQSDFRYWNGPRDRILNKWVVNDCLLPLNDGVIASLMTSGYRIGMSIAEYRLGDGVCLLSQVEAVKRFNTDSVATKYLLNTLNYCLNDWSAPAAPSIEAIDKKGVAFDIDPKNAFYIDIAKECTMGFTDPKAGDQKGGWTDQGPELDLHKLPTGKQVFNGVPFNIINPDENDGKSCIVLRGSLNSKTGFLPLKKRITINQKAHKLYFLISGAWINSKKKELVASLKISEEADGTEMFSFFQIDLIPGKNITDWWNAAAHKPPEAEMGWVGLTGTGLKAYEVGTLIIEWTNPTPQKIIQYIDFTSTENGIPVLLGITGTNQ